MATRTLCNACAVDRCEDARVALEGARLTLRPPQPGDAEALAPIFEHPDVAEWWHSYDLERVREEIDDALVILIDGAVRGWLFVWEEDDPDYRYVHIDIALAADVIGRGYGSEALSLMVRRLIARGHRRFQIDPAADNERAIRAYATVGFRPVGILREQERTPDGTWRDALLMDLLASDLAQSS